MIPALHTHRAAIARLCAQYGVRTLAVFGSASVEGADEAARDVDLVVDFDRLRRERPLPCYFEFKRDLEALLNKPVDLLELQALPESRLKRSIVRTARPFYAATPA